ncbi:hypothetical protein MMC12_008453 [Toensbergia leucococca]|nr:hypothetical protein [Toensbergia leucococca]
MNRAHSSPVPDVPGRTAAMIAVRPPSPLGHHSRRRSPMRRSLDETYSSFGGQVDIGETISENSELDLTPRADVDAVPSSPLTSMHHTFPRTRRRPSSPLHITQVSTQMGVPKSTLRSSISSPSLSSTQFNEPYPSSYFYASSSIPSTPTSFRSRSPSISSLETIPDSPNAEQEAVEADAVAKLKAAADRENDREEPASVRRRPSLDVVGRGGAMVLGTNGFGVVYGARDKRKRWSVCGAERRGDLDLETIWED